MIKWKVAGVFLIYISLVAIVLFIFVHRPKSIFQQVDEVSGAETWRLDYMNDSLFAILHEHVSTPTIVTVEETRKIHCGGADCIMKFDSSDRALVLEAAGER